MVPLPHQILSLDEMIVFLIKQNGIIHGYGITQIFEEKFHWSPSQTAIYNVLKILTEKKVIQFQEKIEKGRVQKLYSLTDFGLQEFDKNKEIFMAKMMNRLVNIQKLIQNFTVMGSMKNPEENQKFISLFLRDMHKFSCISFPLLKVAPNEVHQIIKTALASLQELATKHGIDPLENRKNKNCSFNIQPES